MTMKKSCIITRRILCCNRREFYMASIREIADKAGVGIGTVSRALSGNGYINEEKKELIQQIAKELGYNPEDKRKRKDHRSGIVGVILPDTSQPFFGNFLKYVEAALLSLGYRTVIINSMGVQGKVTEAIELIENHVLDGLIVNAEVSKSEVKRMSKVPCVSFECELGNAIPLVASDHVRGGRLAAKILFRCGCKDVVILSTKAKTPVYARYRIEECRRLLKKQGIHVTIVECVGNQNSYQKMGEMINDFMNTYQKMDGIFTEDIEAYYCLSQAKKRGIIVPRDLKIVGYDGNEITKMISPQITTIEQNVPLLAKKSAEILQKCIEGQKTDRLNLVPVRALKGGTTE